jgi:hypothetical protein
LEVQGRLVGMAQLDEIIADVMSMGLGDDDQIADELLHRAKVFNFIPAKMNFDYGAALLREYHRQKSES